jgi:hypothetical protein
MAGSPYATRATLIATTARYDGGGTETEAEMYGHRSLSAEADRRQRIRATGKGDHQP